MMEVACIFHQISISTIIILIKHQTEVLHAKPGHGTRDSELFTKVVIVYLSQTMFKDLLLQNSRKKNNI